MSSCAAARASHKHKLLTAAVGKVCLDLIARKRVVEVGIEPCLEEVRGGFGVVVSWPAAVALPRCFRRGDGRQVQLAACPQWGTHGALKAAQTPRAGGRSGKPSRLFLTSFYHYATAMRSAGAQKHAMLIIMHHARRVIPAIFLAGGRHLASLLAPASSMALWLV